MILYIDEQFCDMYDEETYEEVLKLYNLYSINYKVGYKFKVCVLEQKIVLDEFKVNELFDLWPLLDISWGGCGNGCEMSLTINGTKSKE